jgi:FkbM family methyltransferase
LRSLIYDVGVDDGRDTAYYLSRGFSVVGIEASPGSVKNLTKRFAKEISDGTFILLNFGIAADEGEFDFWVCDDAPEWSSFDRVIASRNGSRHHAVRVKTKRFAHIIGEFGTPFYCKIDIEGNDRACIQDLTPLTAPEYISIEMSHSSGDVDLGILKELGYSQFKIINQWTHAPASRILTSVSPLIGNRARSLLHRVDRRLRGARSDNDWHFTLGSSGPIGHETRGAWSTYSDALSLWSFLRDADRRAGTKGLGDWFDVHARREEISR